MFYEKRHFAYSPTIGGKSVSADRTINELDTEDRKMSIYFKGTYSNYNPIGYYSGLTAVVRKPSSSNYTQKDFKLRGFRLGGGLNTCGGDFNTNQSISFSKQDLLRIANQMDEDNSLIISVPTTFNTTKFIRSVDEVTKW